jgi:hypothetical protein
VWPRSLPDLKTERKRERLRSSVQALLSDQRSVLLHCDVSQLRLAATNLRAIFADASPQGAARASPSPCWGGARSARVNRHFGNAVDLRANEPLRRRLALISRWVARHAKHAIESRIGVNT